MAFKEFFELAWEQRSFLNHMLLQFFPKVTTIPPWEPQLLENTLVYDHLYNKTKKLIIITLIN